MKKFLASVGNAKLLARTATGVEAIADVRTLTESTLSFTTSMEEVRAGEGAQLYGRFSHDAGMTIQLTDAMFDINYIAKQVGAATVKDPSDQKDLYQDELTSSETNSDYYISSFNPQLQPIGEACGLDKKVLWIREKGCGDKDWNAIVVEGDKISAEQFENAGVKGKNVCIEYFANKPGKRVDVYSNFIPSELILILTTKLFAGDASAPETGTEVGHITVKVPRFQLDGQFDLSMAMSSAATMSLNGTALATNENGCQDRGIYAEIIEFTAQDAQNYDLAQDIKELAIDPLTTQAGDKIGELTVFAQYKNGEIKQIARENISVVEDAGTTKLAADYVMKAGSSYTVTVSKAGSVIKTKAEVQAGEKDEFETLTGGAAVGEYFAAEFFTIPAAN